MEKTHSNFGRWLPVLVNYIPMTSPSWRRKKTKWNLSPCALIMSWYSVWNRQGFTRCRTYIIYKKETPLFPLHHSFFTLPIGDCGSILNREQQMHLCGLSCIWCYCNHTPCARQWRITVCSVMYWSNPFPLKPAESRVIARWPPCLVWRVCLSVLVALSCGLAN